MKKNVSANLFICVFAAAVILIGSFSFAGLVKTYISEEAVDNEWTEALGSKFETDIAVSFFQKFSFININGAIRRFLGQREMNGVVKLNNGYLLTTIEACSDEDLRELAEKTAGFKEYLKSRGTDLVYVSTLYTSGKFDPELPPGVEDHGNRNTDRFLPMLREKGIDVIDFREVMAADEIDHYDMMYKTDHHWTTEAGFYAYGVLENYIAEKTGCETDSRIADISNYTVTKYEKWHLGSRGQRTGRYFAGIDDFTLIVPEFDTKIKDPYGNVGKAEDFFLDMGPLQNRDYTSRYTYDLALGGPAYLGHYVNLESKNDVKIMIITDSFGKAVNPYLVMGFAEVNCLYDGYVGGITPEMIEAYDPDVVIMMYYPEYISAHSPSFDFREF